MSFVFGDALGDDELSVHYLTMMTAPSSPSIGDMLGLCASARDEAEYWKGRFEASQNEIWRLRTESPLECSNEGLWLPLALLAVGLVVAVRVLSRRDRVGRKALLRKVDATLKRRLSETPRPPAALNASPSMASLMTSCTNNSATCESSPSLCCLRALEGPSFPDRGDLSPKDSATIAKQEEFLRGLFGDYEKLTPTKAREVGIGNVVHGALVYCAQLGVRIERRVTECMPEDGHLLLSVDVLDYSMTKHGFFALRPLVVAVVNGDLLAGHGDTRRNTSDRIATARKNIGDFSRMDDVCHSLVYRGHTINFYRERPYIYVVVAVEKEGGAELPSMVLKRMAAEITPKNRQLPSVIAMTRELKAIIDAGNGVKMTMISQVEDELDAVADIMVENIS
ncbi:hypothetical protein FOZ62_002183 [Perkinsus olseni]|uniref:Uncharacterized protein n=1 Tax=Perkinsus olseni TaxID=32597 RepID=A0A7J6QP28_PEROL|nr:hypothetical protein FOZ62_002183 [Perkinsus olseni]